MNKKEHICVVCGKNFDPTKVDHSSSWWKRSDGKRYEREKYCSVECIGHADANWRMSDDYLDEASVEKNQKCSQDEYPNTAEIMLTASDVHPKLPSALVLITDGATQAEAARLVGINEGDLSGKLSQLRKLLKSRKL